MQITYRTDIAYYFWLLSQFRLFCCSYNAHWIGMFSLFCQRWIETSCIPIISYWHEWHSYHFLLFGFCIFRKMMLHIVIAFCREEVGHEKFRISFSFMIIWYFYCLDSFYMDEFSFRIDCSLPKPSFKCLTTGLTDLADRALCSLHRGEPVGWHNVIQVSVGNIRSPRRNPTSHWPLWGYFALKQ